MPIGTAATQHCPVSFYVYFATDTIFYPQTDRSPHPDLTDADPTPEK